MWRVVWVPVAFLISAAVAGAVILTVGAERITQEMAARRGAPADQIDIWFGYFDQAQYLAHVLSALSLLPAVLLVIVGEVARIRSAVYYVIGGGLAVAAGPMLTRAAAQAGALALPSLPSASVLQILATAGFAAGLVYWLIAGRSA
jgi:hypothetical protein